MAQQQTRGYNGRIRLTGQPRGPLQDEVDEVWPPPYRFSGLRVSRCILPTGDEDPARARHVEAYLARRG